MGNRPADHFIPEIYHHELAPGLRVVGMEYDRVPWVSLTCMIKRGAETAPAGKEGVADLTAELLTLGTARRDQLELALETESRGASLTAHARWDHTTITIEGLAEDYEDLLALLAEVVLQPGFPEGEFALLQERRQAELIHLRDDPREMANRCYFRLFFGDSPYGRPVNGDLESVAALTLTDLKEWYRAQCQPVAATLAVVGMVPRDRVVAAAQHRFGDWRPAGEPTPVYDAPPSRPGAPGIYLVDRPDLTQSEIRAGHLGLPRRHPDFFPLRLVNYVLGGGGFSSRLMARVRSDLGLTYGINSHFHFRRAPGPFIISTFTPAPHTAQVVSEIQAVMRELRQGGLTPEELANAQSYYVGHFPLGLETPGGLARQLVSIDLHDLERDYLNTYRHRLQAVTLEQAQAAARAHLHPDDLVILVYGPAAVCQGDLEKLGAVTLLPL